MFVPKLFVSLKNYTIEQFYKDLLAGIIVGIVALPLCIAFAIASGVSPEKGLITGVIGGFFISFLGGSRVQIGGPTGAFIIIVYGIVQTHGVEGLILATFMAGIILFIMGLTRMGSIIKYIPYPLIVGFTSGIAIVIFTSQLKDFFGLNIITLPANFIDTWKVYFTNFQSLNFTALAIGAFTIFAIIFMQKISIKVPGSLIAILSTTIIVQYFGLEVETIGTKFGNISINFPIPQLPHFNFTSIQKLIRPAFTIAILGGIESLLSAVVSDGMIGGNHKSNVELAGQGIANIASAIFGGIPATGAIARTMTNVKNGGRTPVAGIVHAFSLLLIMLVFGKWATLIPLSCLAGILIVVAYNMSEWRSVISIINTSKSEAAVLLTTLFFTIFFDLTIAIEIGMVLASFLFMRRMIQISNVNFISNELKEEQSDQKAISKYIIPKGVEVFEINGPLFFGAAYKFKESIKLLSKTPKILIVRMRQVPVIDATGLHTLKEILVQTQHQGTKIILSGVLPSLYKELEKPNIIGLVGKTNVFEDIDEALIHANNLMNQNI
ncbi:MAG: SulP family inorganic anion transporter [Saprospiraceae bacterium]